ncbi:MAG TPA: sigma-70 family RNA polymerase sigma factor [Planctomycetota bacterium]|nr:sigma-70 family RNA polymerase sigma factor [Planctomycetota bacterium]
MNQQNVWARAIVEQNRRWLMAYFLAATGDAHFSEDLVQEVFAEALSSADRFDPSQSFGAWLRGIARNILLQHYRQARHKFISIDESVLNRFEYAAEQCETAHAIPGYAQARLDALKTCLADLTERTRTAIELKYTQQMRSREIAEKLAMQSTAVDMLISRARRALEECILRKLRSTHG